MTAVLGIDPGSTSGACVLLSASGRTVLYWLAYWRRQTGMYATVSSEPLTGLVELSCVARAGDRAAIELEGYGYALCVEALFARRGGKAGPDTLVKLGEACGAFVGPLEVPAGCSGRLERPRASEDWRPAVLGLTRGYDARKAEAYAVLMVPQLFGWPGGWPELRSGAAQGALAEAACIARWGVTCARG